MTGPFKLLLIGDSDSQLLACEALCRFPSELNVQVTINAIPRDGTPAVSYTHLTLPTKRIV